MENCFVLCLVNQYDTLFNPIIKENCKCYQQFALFDNLLEEKKSYACCIQQPKRIAHLSLPIMFGSMIDLKIRNVNANNDPLSQLYGAMLLDGSLKIIPNFLTNNLRGGHCYCYRKKKKLPKMLVKILKPSTFPIITYRILITYNNIKYTIEFFDDYIYIVESLIDQVFLKKKRNEKIVHNLQASLYHISENKFIFGDLCWFKLLTTYNKYGTFTREEYINFINTCKKNSPKLDDLANKVIITPPTLIQDAIFLLKHFDATKFRNTLNNGNFFFALSNNRNTNIALSGQFKSMFTIIEGHKIDQIQTLVTAIKRHTNQKSQNSQAMLYSTDTYPFLCPFTIKEMKDVGENIYLTNNVIISYKVDIEIINKYFEENKDMYKQTTLNNIQIILDGYLTNYYTNINLSNIIKIKQDLNVTVMLLSNKYLIIQHGGNIPIKYSKDLNMYISPSEYKLFGKHVFDNNHYLDAFSLFGKYLPKYYNYMLPEKITVTINNIKGKCCELRNSHMLKFFLFTNHYNTAIFHNGKKQIVSSFNNNVCNITFNEDIDYTKYSIIPNEKPFINEEYFALTKTFLQTKKQAITHQTVITKNTKKNIKKNINNNKKTKTETIFILNEIDKQRTQIDDINMDISSNIQVTNINQNLNTTLNNQNKTHENDFVQSTENNILNIKTFISNAEKIDRTSNNDKSSNGKSYNTPVKNSILINKCNIFSDINTTIATTTTKNIKTNTQDHIIQNNGTMHNDCMQTLSVSSNRTTINDEPSCAMQEEWIFPYKIERGEYTRCTNSVRHHFIANVAFGDISGYTNEDGFIIDKKFIENGPKLLVSTTLHVKFKDSTVTATTLNYKKMAKNCKIKYIPINMQLGNDIIIGIVCSIKQLTPILTGSTVSIICTEIGRRFYYMLCLKNFSTFMNINSYLIDSTVIFNIRLVKNFLLSSKLLLNHGQKGVICKICKIFDLSKFKFYKQDGTCVHPQILISIQSLIGRTVASQVLEMLDNKHLAFNDKGFFLAPLPFTVHHIDITNEMRFGPQKIDLMTNECGLISNGFSYLYDYLQNQIAGQDSTHRFHIVRQLLAAFNYNFNFK